MKKALYLILAVAMMLTLCISTAAAEVPQDGLVAWYKLDGNFKNEVTGKEVETFYGSGSQFGEALWEVDEYEFYAGADGNSFMCAGDGFDLGVKPENTDFTFSMWTLVASNPGITPFMWFGSQTQSPENWIGIWNCNTSDWSTPVGPCIGSNDSTGSRLAVYPEVTLYDTENTELILPWTHVVVSAVLDTEANTYTVTLYHNGQNVGSTPGLPNPYVEGDDTCSMYINGVNAWTDPGVDGWLDDLLLYNRALSDDEVAALYASYGEVTTPATYSEMSDTLVGGTEEPADTEAPATEAPDTEAPATDAPDTEAPATDAPTTDAPEEKGGCGSVVTGSAMAIVALTAVLGCAVVKKK